MKMVEQRKWVTIFVCILTAMVGAGDAVFCPSCPGHCAASNVAHAHQLCSESSWENAHPHSFRRWISNAVRSLPRKCRGHCLAIPRVMIGRARSPVSDPRSASSVGTGHRTDSGLHSYDSLLFPEVAPPGFLVFHAHRSPPLTTVLII